jgi:SAM-dependent methyltransferase
LQRSKLDEIYFSSKFTCKEMLDKMPGADKISLNLQLELNKYIDPFTNKVNGKFVKLRKNCPLCESNDIEFIFLKHGFDHMICNSCDLIFTLQLLDTNKIKFLEEGEEGDSYGNYKEHSVVNELDKKKFETVFEQLIKNTEIKEIFDFGSQSGTFLDWAKENYNVIGHEYHDTIRNIAKRKGHQVLNDDLSTVSFDKSFDLITCWDYIDHVLEPKKVIGNLSKYLKKGGLFFFAINNRDSLSVRIMHERSPVFIGPHHTMHYGINQLKLLMEGFELVHVESYVSELNWISNWLNFKNPEFGDAKLVFELFDPKKVCELGMGIKLNAVFKKL